MSVFEFNWPPQAWVICLAVNFLNLILVSAVLVELTNHPTLKVVRGGLFLLWVYYFISTYFDPSIQNEPNASLFWINIACIVSLSSALYELRKGRVDAARKEKLRRRAYASVK